MIDAKELQARLRRTSGLTAEDRVDPLLKFADYYRKAMEARRTVGFAAFIAAFGMYGALFIELQKFRWSAMPVSPLWVKGVILVFITLILVAFMSVTWHMELRNGHDRDRYLAAEKEAMKILLPNLEDSGPPESAGWASKGPTIVLGFFWIALAAYIWLVDPSARSAT